MGKWESETLGGVEGEEAFSALGLLIFIALRYARRRCMLCLCVCINETIRLIYFYLCQANNFTFPGDNLINAERYSRSARSFRKWI